VIIKKKINPSTIGFIILPSSVPNSYQIRFGIASFSGAKKVAEKNTINNMIGVTRKMASALGYSSKVQSRQKNHREKQAKPSI
jgi:hypothetical protein